MRTLYMWVAATIMAVLMMFVGAKCSAQTKTKYDTIPCSSIHIKKFATEQTKSGKTKIYAVYCGNGINDLIPVSESVFAYIRLCRANGIEPMLGIKLRNEQISSLIKLKPVYRRKNPRM